MKILITLTLLSFGLFAQDDLKGKLTAFCDGSHLQIDVYSQDGSATKSADLRFSSDCKDALMDLKLGEFEGFSVSAFCNQSDLHIVNALALEARLSIEIIALSNSNDCEVAKQSYNL
jgi:hypothetical protein